MNKLKNNIDKVVANKVLKDINSIVDEDKDKEIQEKKWSKILVSLILAGIVLILILKFFYK